MEKTDRREKAIEMRMQGMRLQEIADQLGVSKQRVAQYLTGLHLNGRRRFAVTKTQCKYVGLREWMLRHGWCMSDLIAACGYIYNPQTATNFQTWFGNKTLRMETINKILDITGLTYEECFGEVYPET